MTELALQFRRPARTAAFGLALVFLSLYVGRTLAMTGTRNAVLIVAVPIFLVLYANVQVLYRLLIAAFIATTALGRDFAYLGANAPLVGRMYILDFLIAGFLVCGLPVVARAVRQAGPAVLLVAAIVGLTFLELLRRPIDSEALRESVIGLYSLWAVVGVTIVYLGKVRTVARALYVGAGIGTVIFGLWFLSASNPVTQKLTPRLVPPSFDLYLGFSVLLLIFVGSSIVSDRRRHLAYGLAFVQAAEIAASGSRSIWVALLIATVGTAVAGGLLPEIRGRLAQFGFGFALIAVATAMFLPSVSDRFVAEAHTIVAYNSVNPSASAVTQLKAENAQWRLERWGQALKNVERHPVAGIGFGVPVIDDPITRNLYLSVGEEPPRIDPHNSFIAFAARMGVIGFALLAAFEIVVFRSGYRLIRRYRGNPLNQQLAAWLLACQLLTAGHSLFTVVLEGPYMGLFFWLFGGILIALDRRTRGADGAAAEAIS